MKRPSVQTLDRWIRSLHLYLGVFLTPWMLVYGTSAFLLNHPDFVRETLQVGPPEWKVVRRVNFVPGDDFPRSPAEQAKAILKLLGLEGPHRIQGRPTPDRLVVFRISGAGHYRVTWNRPEKQLVVERQQPFSSVRLIHFLHFVHGYGQPYWTHRLWGATVDAVAVAIWFWVLSGIYIWARRPKKRLLGGVLLVAGLLAFATLTAGLCL